MDGQHRAIDEAERAAVGGVLDDWGGAGQAGPIARLGGLTNRMYRVPTEAGPVAVRLPGRGTDAYIDRLAEHHNAVVAAGLGLGPTVLHARAGAMVTAFVPGRVLAPADLRAEPRLRIQVASALRRVHDARQTFLASFDPFDVITAYRVTLMAVPDGVDDLIERIGRLPRPEHLVPCHNDPWPENFLDDGERLYLLDWEYSAMGDPAWDLADVIVESRLDGEATDHFLAAYADGPIAAELRERVGAMGPVTDLLWGLWALVQHQDGNDAMDFADYAAGRLRRASRTAA